MSTRSAARSLAVQTLYQLDVNPSSVPEAFEAVAQIHESPLVVHPEVFDEVQGFGRELVLGASERQQELDLLIAEHLSENWTLARLGKVEMAIMRLATFELVARPEIPAPVVLNEALELTRDFLDEGAVKFVNGVLDRVARVVREPTPGA